MKSGGEWQDCKTPQAAIRIFSESLTIWSNLAGICSFFDLGSLKMSENGANQTIILNSGVL
jgi:hypothetical protein